MSERITDPVVRIRVNHAYSVREGWRLAESTVELTVPVPSEEAGDAIFPDLARLLRNAYDTGRHETEERNRLEGRHK